MSVSVITAVVGLHGKTRVLHTDKMNLNAVGKVRSVERWSTIEWDNLLGLWEVRLKSDIEQVLFSNKRRDLCLEFEHVYFNKLAMEGKL